MKHLAVMQAFWQLSIYFNNNKNNKKNIRINHDFATLQFCTLAMPFVAAEVLATFVSIPK